ncbi:hypothetical protein [Gordonia cholesterolivorans]|uniref:Uncharacterized protein n=1 Tax=Gordonia cholesterolivorans TaxID=559625 RepID=A0ABN3HCE3_9ACTN
MTHRWERERAAHLLAGSRAGTDRRRRAEQLARTARRGARSGAGVGQSALVDEVTPSRWRRMTTAEDGSRPLGKKVRVGFGYAVVGAVAGAGIAAGRGMYAGLARISPRVGRLWAWPWGAVAGALGVTLWALDVPFGLGLRFDRRFPLSLFQWGPWWAWALWQTAIALVVTGYLVWAWGWAGVPKGAVAPKERNKDGSFRATPDSKKVRLDLDDEDDAPVAPEPSGPPRREIPLVQLDDEDDRITMYDGLDDEDQP